MEKLLRKTLVNGHFGYVTPERSRIMSQIRGKRNKSTEICLKMALVRSGIRGFILHPKLPGKPDFFFPEHNVAIFVDGCFWHGCDMCGHVPKTNSKFWAMKIQRNIQRDTRNTRLLKAQGIRVVRLWEHQLKKQLQQAVQKVARLVENP